MSGHRLGNTSTCSCFDGLGGDGGVPSGAILKFLFAERKFIEKVNNNLKLLLLLNQLKVV